MVSLYGVGIFSPSHSPDRIPELTLHSPGTPIVLCGTKIDLRNDPFVLKKLMDKKAIPVTTEIGEEYAKKLGCVTYIENSSNDQKNLIDTFCICVSANLRSKTKLLTGKNKGKCELQ